MVASFKCKDIVSSNRKLSYHFHQREHDQVFEMHLTTIFQKPLSYTKRFKLPKLGA